VGGTYTLTADGGTFAVTGTAAGLRAARTLAASAGTFALTGTDASLEFGRVLGADAGAYVLTGTDATLTYTVPGSYTLDAEGGSVVVTGTAATLTARFNFRNTWDQVVPQAVTYTPVVAASGSWAAEAVGVVPPPWAMLTSVTTTADDGVDFMLKLREQYPMYLSSDRPMALYDVYPEGTP
jgi:hypothetical protein